MNIVPIGDQARNSILKTSSQRLNSTMNTLVKELASGEVSDVGLRVQGRTKILNGIESKLILNEEIKLSLREVSGALDLSITILEQVRGVASELSIKLMNQMPGESFESLKHLSEYAEATLKSIMSSMNSEWGGQYIFSGQSTQTRPVASADHLLGLLYAQVEGLTSAEEVELAVNNWFNSSSDDSGYEGTVYFGDLLDRSLLKVGGEDVKFNFSAGSAELKNLIKTVSVASLISRGVLSGDIKEQILLLRKSGDLMYENSKSLTFLQAGIGRLASLVDGRVLGLENESAELEKNLNSIRGVDTYTTAVAISDLEVRIKLIYELMSRLSRLHLSDYIR